MLQFEDEVRFDPLAREFRAAFQRRLADLQVREEFSNRLVVTIPALHPETGNIAVWLGDEVTVGIGEHFHASLRHTLDEAVTPSGTEWRPSKGGAISPLLANIYLHSLDKEVFAPNTKV
jgi:hypothetical protein